MPETAIQQLRSLPPSELADARSAVKVLIITGLGLNCEAETEAAFKMVGAAPERVHLLDLLDGTAERTLADYEALAFIGGFAFGDHLGAGFVFANKIRWRLYDQLVAFVENGGHAMGVCNGFQTMVRLGIVPGLDGDYRTPRATLAPNDRHGYRDAWVKLSVDPDSPCVWTQGIETIELPARHGEGKLLCESEELLARLEAAHQVPVRYVDAAGAPTMSWPENPNGSPDAAAGLCDPSGRLFGLMPHPDAFLYPFQHPQWSRWKAAGTVPAEGAGLAMFRNGVDSAAAARA
jgi:phosphoribosylformylglycinamidine synthase